MSVSKVFCFVSLMVFAQLALSACHEQTAATNVGQAAEVQTNTSKQLDWIDLLPANVDREALMERYADLVIQRLDRSEDASLQEQILSEFKQAPINPHLNGLKVRLAGYMAVLDDRDGRINEFLLVPYSGAGIHQPAPPANQLVLVRLQPEQALATNTQYEAVWVEGVLQVQTTSTSVAEASYALDNAQVQPYTAEDAKQAEAVQAKHEQAHD